MIESPKSLTAVIHIRFHYREEESKPTTESGIEILSKLIDRVSELDPEYQELLIKFANHLKEMCNKEGR